MQHMSEPTLGDAMDALGDAVEAFYAAASKIQSCKCSAYDFPHRKGSGLCGKRTCSCQPIIGEGGKDYGLSCKNPENCPHG
jgi:hypothetical protein